jgi:predicted DNA-binding transcriptional regulator YafY
VLAVLELLQSRGRMTGAELARELDVNVRTARRYVEALQELGVPVEAERGRYGAYRLRPGYKLPPLIFAEDEALALTLGLLVARRLGLGGAAPAIDRALAKIERVMPARLRARVQAVEASLVLDVGSGGVAPDSAVVLALSEAVRTRRRVRLRYRSGSEETRRDVDPYGLVFRAGTWYTTGYCHLRRDLRLFRLDRILAVELRDETFERPPGFDALEEVRRRLASIPHGWPVEVLLETTLARASRRVPPTGATLEEAPGGVLLRCFSADLPRMAQFLSGLGFPLAVQHPPELRDALRQHADVIAEYAARR